MKLVTRNSDYAIRAVLVMASKKKGEVISVNYLIKELKMPRPFLRKILQALNKKGLLISYRGKGGGFVLAKVPAKMKLLDVIEAFQGPLSLNQCFFRKKLCPNIKRCPVKKKIDNIERFARKELASINMADLIRN